MFEEINGIVTNGDVGITSITFLNLLFLFFDFVKVAVKRKVSIPHYLFFLNNIHLNLKKKLIKILLPYFANFASLIF